MIKALFHIFNFKEGLSRSEFWPFILCLYVLQILFIVSLFKFLYLSLATFVITEIFFVILFLSALIRRFLDAGHPRALAVFAGSLFIIFIIVALLNRGNPLQNQFTFLAVMFFGGINLLALKGSKNKVYKKGKFDDFKKKWFPKNNNNSYAKYQTRGTTYKYGQEVKHCQFRDDLVKKDEESLEHNENIKEEPFDKIQESNAQNNKEINDPFKVNMDDFKVDESIFKLDKDNFDSKK